MDKSKAVQSTSTPPGAVRFAYRKLIRDKILDSMQAGGQMPDFRIMDHAEFLEELIKKLLEEAGEIDSSIQDEIFDGLVDLSEVMRAILASINKTEQELQLAQELKRNKYGGFESKIYLDSALTPPDNPWFNYLKSHPDRYPEIKS